MDTFENEFFDLERTPYSTPGREWANKPEEVEYLYSNSKHLIGTMVLYANLL
jgi:hypothetical protein